MLGVRGLSSGILHITFAIIYAINSSLSGGFSLFGKVITISNSFVIDQFRVLTSSWFNFCGLS